MQNKKQPRLMLARLTEIKLWLNSNFFREGRDYTYRVEEPYVYFDIKSRTVEQQVKHRDFERKWTPHYR